MSQTCPSVPPSQISYVTVEYSRGGPYMHIVDVTNVTTNLLAFRVVEHNLGRWKRSNIHTGHLECLQQYSAIFETDATDLPPLTFTVHAMPWHNKDEPTRESFDGAGPEMVEIITLRERGLQEKQQKETCDKAWAANKRAVTFPSDPILERAIQAAQNESDDFDHVKFEEGTSVMRPAEPTPPTSPVEEGEEPVVIPPPDTHFVYIANPHDFSVATYQSYQIMANTRHEKNEHGFPVGLRNVGSTCFMNAVIQCLYFTPALREYFCYDPYPFIHDVNYGSERKSQGVMAANFSALTFIMTARDCKYFIPKRFRDAVVVATGHFEEMIEHDAQELLSMLIDALHEDLNKGDKTYRIPEQNNINLRGSAEVTAAADDAWNAYKKNTWSAIYDLFTGQTVSTMQCSHCALESQTFDIFTQIAVEIPPSGAQLSDCLSSHFVREQLCEAVWDCPSCQVRRKATKEIKLWRLPRYLIIQLKRFKPGAEGGMEKDTAEVRYPFELSDESMRAHMHEHSDRDQTRLYHLYAIVQHSGRLQTGHYTASTREGRQCYQFDDEEVYNDDDGFLTHTQSAYLLFYQRSK